MGILLSYELLISLTFGLLSLYFWFKYKFTYWSRRSVIGPKPVFPFGNIRDVIYRKSQFFQPYCDNYVKFRNLPYAGMYCFHRPVLCINDPELARLVLIKDFDHFQAHGIFSEGANDPLAGHMFNIHGERWKNLRLRMSTAFSPGKLKTIYPLVENIAHQAVEYLSMMNKKSDAFNFSEFYEKYTMEIIASVGFGIECKGFDNSNAEFFDRGNEYFVPKSVYWTFIRAVAFFAPDLFKLLRIRRFSAQMSNFFYGLVQQTVEYRERNSYRRNDFIQALIELKKQQDSENEENKQQSNFTFTMDDLAANTMLYMVAGYETSATVGQFAVYELALNPQVQEKARVEVMEVLARHRGECTYEAQNEMTYLNMVFDETMRKYPPMRALFRRCNKDYQFPDGLVVEKGTLVFIPSQAIQMDPEYFPEPDKFDPNRFLPENKAKMHRCHWMPFGEGPRKCLGLRQGYVQVKIALVKILQKYQLVLDKKTTVPVKIKATALSYASDSGVWVKLKPITQEKYKDTNNN